MDLDIIIVNWNGGAALARCIQSISGSLHGGVTLRRLVVVDNASSDGSVDELRAPGLPLQVIRNADNLGFAAACNQGARGSEAQFLLFLNPDTELYPDSLRVPLRFMGEPENQAVGITGIQLLDETGEPSRSCARFPTSGRLCSKMLGLDRLSPSRFPGVIMEDWAHDSTREVDHVIGAFFLVRRGLFEQLGGFDERYFVYLEDLDFSLRARRAGWKSVYLAAAQAFHKGGGTSDQVRAKRLFYSLRSRILFVAKHFHPAPAVALSLGTLLVEPLLRLGWAAARGAGRDVMETLEGYLMLWRAIPATFSVARRGAIG